MSRTRRIMGSSWKTRFHELLIEHESKMRLLKTHAHTSEQRGSEAGKVRQKRERKKGRPKPQGVGRIRPRKSSSPSHPQRGEGEEVSMEKRKVITKNNCSVFRVPRSALSRYAILLHLLGPPSCQHLRLQLRGAILNRTCGTHKNLHI